MLREDRKELTQFKNLVKKGSEKGALVEVSWGPGDEDEDEDNQDPDSSTDESISDADPGL